MRARRVALACLLGWLLAHSPGASAAFERHEIVDASGVVVAVVVLDSEKAITRGSDRGFLVLVENPNATANVTVRLFAVGSNVTGLAFEPSRNEGVEPLGLAEMSFRVRAGRDAPLGRHPIGLVVAVAHGGNVTASRLSVALEVSDLPTPFGETVDTLSPGERATLSVGLLGLVGGALAAGLFRRLRRGR